MNKGETFELGAYDKILVPNSLYNNSEDKRLLIPFTNGRKIGFMDKNNVVIVPPEYSAYYGDCYNENDYVRVEKAFIDWVSFNHGTSIQYLYGLIDYKGEIVFPCEYLRILPAYGTESNIFTIQHPQEGWAVVTADGEEIISFGEYQEISGFNKGFAQVKQNGKYGIINEAGELVVPVEYDTIQNFYSQQWFAAKLEKSGKKYNFWFKDKRITLFNN